MLEGSDMERERKPESGVDERGKGEGSRKRKGESGCEEEVAKGRTGAMGVCEILGLVVGEGDQQTSIFPRLGLKLVKLRMC